MKHFLDRITGEIFAYEDDGSQDEFIKEGLDPVSDQELTALRKAQDDALAPTPEQMLQAASIKRDELLAIAALRIAPLQDAIDLGESTNSDEVRLTLWKKYRVAVNRVTEQPDYPCEVTWPTPPAE